MGYLKVKEERVNNSEIWNFELEQKLMAQFTFEVWPLSSGTTSLSVDRFMDIVLLNKISIDKHKVIGIGSFYFNEQISRKIINRVLTMAFLKMFFFKFRHRHLVWALSTHVYVRLKPFLLKNGFTPVDLFGQKISSKVFVTELTFRNLVKVYKMVFQLNQTREIESICRSAFLHSGKSYS